MRARRRWLGAALLLGATGLVPAGTLVGGDGGGDPPPLDNPQARQRRTLERSIDELLSPEGDVPVGGRDLEAPVQVDGRTRAQVAKDVLRNVFTAYLDRDLFGFFKYLSPEALISAGIVRNAIQEDFQNLADVNIDVEVLEYRFTFDTICTRFLWRRVTTDQTSGVPSQLQGECQFCLDKNLGARVDRVIGLPPFGLSDPQFRAQVIAGQPQATVQSGPKTFTLALGLLAQGKPVFLDLDNGTFREAIAVPGGRGGFQVQANDDVLITLVGAAGMPFTLPPADGGGGNLGGGDVANDGNLPDYQVSAQSMVRGESCTGNRSLSQIGRVTEASLQNPSTLAITTNVPRTGGFKTSDGNFALVEFTLPNTAVIKVGDTVAVNPPLASECVEDGAGR